MNGCSTDGSNSVASFIFAPPQIGMSELACETSCSLNPICDYFIHEFTVCYLGHFEDSNPIPKPALLLGSVDVFLKDVSKSTDSALQSCKN